MHRMYEPKFYRMHPDVLWSLFGYTQVLVTAPLWLNKEEGRNLNKQGESVQKTQKYWEEMMFQPKHLKVLELD